MPIEQNKKTYLFAQCYKNQLKPVLKKPAFVFQQLHYPNEIVITVHNNLLPQHCKAELIDKALTSLKNYPENTDLLDELRKYIKNDVFEWVGGFAASGGTALSASICGGISNIFMLMAILVAIVVTPGSSLVFFIAGALGLIGAGFFCLNALLTFDSFDGDRYFLRGCVGLLTFTLTQLTFGVAAVIAGLFMPPTTAIAVIIGLCCFHVPLVGLLTGMVHLCFQRTRQLSSPAYLNEIEQNIRNLITPLRPCERQENFLAAPQPNNKPTTTQQATRSRSSLFFSNNPTTRGKSFEKNDANLPSCSY